MSSGIPLTIRHHRGKAFPRARSQASLLPPRSVLLAGRSDGSSTGSMTGGTESQSNPAVGFCCLWHTRHADPADQYSNPGSLCRRSAMKVPWSPGVLRARRRPPRDHRWFVRRTEDLAAAAGHRVDADAWLEEFDPALARIAGHALAQRVVQLPQAIGIPMRRRDDVNTASHRPALQAGRQAGGHQIAVFLPIRPRRSQRTTFLGPGHVARRPPMRHTHRRHRGPAAETNADPARPAR